MNRNKILILVALAVTAGFCATYTIAQTSGKCKTKCPRRKMCGPESKELAELNTGVKLVKQISDLTGKPNYAGLLAVGGLKDDAPGTPAEKIAHLEDLLKTTKSLTLRNAIRLNLKDLYQEANQKDKMVQSLKEMAKENDAALVEWEAILKKAALDD